MQIKMLLTQSNERFNPQPNRIAGFKVTGYFFHALFSVFCDVSLRHSMFTISNIAGKSSKF